MVSSWKDFELLGGSPILLHGHGCRPYAVRRGKKLIGIWTPVVPEIYEFHYRNGLIVHQSRRTGRTVLRWRGVRSSKTWAIRYTLLPNLCAETARLLQIGLI